MARKESGWESRVVHKPVSVEDDAAGPASECPPSHRNRLAKPLSAKTPISNEAVAWLVGHYQIKPKYLDQYLQADCYHCEPPLTVQLRPHYSKIIEVFSDLTISVLHDSLYRQQAIPTRAQLGTRFRATKDIFPERLRETIPEIDPYQTAVLQKIYDQWQARMRLGVDHIQTTMTKGQDTSMAR
ncbi:MAG: hypothetical protein V4735_03485 [Pseudomonadota bacterium]